MAPLVFGIDETLERRRGAKIQARGVYRDAVRSSRHQLVKASGLRWISLMWLGQVPWAGRYWALPVLVPSARYYQERGCRHKKLTDWAHYWLSPFRGNLTCFGHPAVLGLCMFRVTRPAH